MRDTVFVTTTINGKIAIDILKQKKNHLRLLDIYFTFWFWTVTLNDSREKSDCK